ncbi:MAG: CoA transferase [Desulfarculaceae bacterium]|jgi:benzylsuccinate CoA-transferase BbsF subunit
MSRQVFEGLKVLDFSWAIAAPWMVKYLADFGATVIHVESRQHPDMIRTGPPFHENKTGIDNSVYFANYHCNKLGLSLNLKHPRAMEVVEGLVAWADVLVENFMPGVMKSWGLDYERIAEIKPDIVMISQSQCGQEGPLAQVRGTGVQLTAYAGFNHLTGWPDREPSVLYGGYTDCPAARMALVALVSALLRRKREGKGAYIDLSQYEAGIALMVPLILDYRINGQVAMRQGNYDPVAVPHAVYPCQGDDYWCAVAVNNNQQWQGLCRAMEQPDLADDPRFASLAQRKENEAQLDELVAQWTVTLPPQEVMLRLQEQGVPCGRVHKGQDLYEDPQLRHRGFYWQVEHPVIGCHELESQAFLMSETPPRMNMPAPCLGEHNEQVCREILGLSDEQFVELMVEGVFE